jgi:hypothetical protein
MTEARMRQRVVKALRPLDAISVENMVGIGTPDVNYAEGWLELKFKKAWPKRETTALKFPHFTEQQRVWLKRRSRKGGTAYLLVLVGREWFLFHPNADPDREIGRTATRDRFYELSTWHASGPSALQSLRDFLSST